MESDPFQWEWRNFDCVAMIPTMLRMYLRACGQVSGPVNAPVEVIPSDSEEDDDEEEDSNPWKRVKNDFEADDKNEAADWKAIFPRITLIPNGIAIFKAMEFNLRCSESMPDFSRVGMMNEDIPNVPRRGPSPPRGFFRVTAISRELHTLNSHLGDWIELGISEFARIPDCMMPILDLAG
ncbi:hypothetical protein AXX17_AT5G37300 [Arabidopsis thaliana]|uniref:Uncharacterized protein n=1 Tax=Arabidopsis thaliana TaxID=3702 RepID=A0A178UCX6_ARATH|nr:hypothetical protein AXX17_AT5G37300 [Arabidopsis thaliana]